MSTVHAPTTTTEPGKVAGWAGRTREFFVAVRTELDKVTWPTRSELIKATRMIIVLSLLLGVTIGLMDWLLQKILVEGIARIGR
jgi:preprotein translocase subunit SecE